MQEYLKENFMKYKKNRKFVWCGISAKAEMFQFCQPVKYFTKGDASDTFFSCKKDAEMGKR